MATDGGWDAKGDDWEAVVGVMVGKVAPPLGREGDELVVGRRTLAEFFQDHSASSLVLNEEIGCSCGFNEGRDGIDFAQHLENEADEAFWPMAFADPQ